MNCLRKSAFLRAVTWLALVLVVALAADLIEDLVFEIDEAAAVDGEGQAEATDEDIVPSHKFGGSTPLSHPVLLTHALSTVGTLWLTQADPSGGRVLIHGPPSAPHRSFPPTLPLRI
jgi:hypothetical protein